jgi:inhibitor of KinA sporulation pathway (predicted exonuclease)
MAKQLDHVIVIDIEATCWDGDPPPKQTSDIIEIGICPLELSTGRRLERRSLLVRPTRSTVSPFCTQLTTLTQQDVDGGISFADACLILDREYITQRRVWASYGDYDRKQIERQCKDMGVRYPFGPSHLNVKTLFALMRGMNHEVGMAQAVDMLGFHLSGTHHRGHDDAWNIAGILASLLGKGSGEPRQS